uniref:5-formyltetrahydrofolate cyclo-ligase n=1 Tax=Anopheles culicifacies TaxID=139723 RepID=A0A182MNF5_9DIPT
MVASEAEDDVQKSSPPAMENNEESAPSKRFYRMEVWSAMKPLFPQGSALSRYVNRKIPLFPHAEQTAERLAETPEFKDAKNIKVNIDMAQESVKLQVLKANKTLFVAPSQKSDYLYAKIKVPGSLEEVPLVQQRRIVKMLADEDTYEELGIDQTEALDMIVVGCVAVSERGQRIGKGNGYVDLEIGILQTLGLITPKTVIATTVADEQVYKELPAELFQKYDFTVDLIVTPTRVIRVDPRPDPRAIGVQWGLLSSRRLDVVRVLRKLKERLEKEGQVIELKDEDTDVESFAKRRTRGNGSGGGGACQQERRRQQNRRRRSTRNSTADGHNDTKSGNERDGNGEGNGEGNESGEGGGRMRRKRRFYRKYNRYSRRDSPGYGSPDGDDYGGEQQQQHQPQQRQRPHKGGGRMRPNHKSGGDDDEGGNNSGRGRQQKQSRPPRQLKPLLQDSVRIRVSNMFSVPFKHFKAELRNRDCYPGKISQSRNGRCLLIFPKREDTEEQVQADELLQKLADMRITVPQKNSNEPKQIKLKCELQPKSRDFEEHDAISVTSAANRAAMQSSAACAKLTSAPEDPNAPPANVEELTVKVQAAALLAALAAKAACGIADKVAEETKPMMEAEEYKKDDKLPELLDAVVKAGKRVLDAATKLEAAVGTKANATDATKVEAAVADASKGEEAATTTSTTVTEPPPTKEAAIEMNSAVQEAARATAALSLAAATLYEHATPPQATVTVASVQRLTRIFRSLLPEASS